METQQVNQDIWKQKPQDDFKSKVPGSANDVMTASIISVTSSLNSPLDSGIQLLDSESEITSVMSNSCDIDTLPTLEAEDDESEDKSSNTRTPEIQPTVKSDISPYGSSNDQTESKFDDKIIPSDYEEYFKGGNVTRCSEKIDLKITCTEPDGTNTTHSNTDLKVKDRNVMTKSDIANQNISHVDISCYSTSAPTMEFLSSFMHSNRDIAGRYQNDCVSVEVNCINDDTIEVVQLEHPLDPPTENDPDSKVETESDIMNVSLNSYELLDYTFQNVKLPVDPPESDQMHVSISEEVNENLKLSSANAIDLKTVQEIQNVEEIQNIEEVKVEKDLPQDEQIVFRRQRKKKNKSDTPKKRVSFHEDILNSTKIDDIHINHGFITHEPDVSVSFFQRGFIRKPDVVKGRYSWAAEGDAPYYEDTKPHREVKSDIYMHTARMSSTSSSSSASISSSIDEEDNSDDGIVKKLPTLGQPKSSCLKKTKHTKKVIDTNIVEEEVKMRKKKSESNLLDSNIFGSLKNILSFSTSVPLLAERGVPEGQEDITVYSSSHDLTYSTSRRSSVANLIPKSIETYEVTPAEVKKVDPLEMARNNLKLTMSEGFYPNYPNPQQLTNVIICDSNVYEHKGISYSYEYDNFKKTFEQEKPKSSTIYQKILKEFNFFKRKATQPQVSDDKDDFEFLENTTSAEVTPEEKKEEPEPKPHSSPINKYASSTRMDWSDNETVSDFTEASGSTRHLNSPKHRINKPNHYSVQNFKMDACDKSDILDVSLSSCKSQPVLRPSSSKSSLINRFLRNVTLKKMLDIKLQKKQKSARRYLGLYPKGLKVDNVMNDDLDKLIVDEIINGKEAKQSKEIQYDRAVLYRLRNEVFINKQENLIRIFPVHSAYTTSGESKALVVILTNSTLYICSCNPNNSYCKHYVLPFTEINTLMIGPNAQTIHISNNDNDMQCIITTGSSQLTGDLVGQLEMAMRKDINKPRLPAVKQLTMRDMINLRKAICKQTSVGKDEEYFHYSIVNIQEYNMDVSDTPLGPNKEGPLMFRIPDTESRWETAYFILKAGVLYMLSSPSHRVPMRVLPLINGACQGACRLYDCPRPHTFQLLIGSTSLHLAAPDEYVASDWLQALVHAASGTYNHKEKLIAQSCSLLMTSDHILTVREAFPCTVSTSKNMRPHDPIKGAQALSCAAISDITAFRLPSAEQSWCVLEFACREVHESSGDWILYFSTNSELEAFISTLEMLWAYHNEEGESFPLSTISEADPLNKKCVDTYNSLQNAWSYLKINLQTF